MISDLSGSGFHSTWSTLPKSYRSSYSANPPPSHIHALDIETINDNFSVFSIDATTSYGSLGRLVNDSEQGSPSCNSKMKKIIIRNCPCLALFVTKDINIGEEIRYDYGTPNVWWRQVCI